MPMTVIRGFQQGQAHAAVALGFHHAQPPGIGDAEVAPGNGNLHTEELCSEVRTRCHGQLFRFIRERWIDAGDFVEEDVADFGGSYESPEPGFGWACRGRVGR
jgi:hypothetical protein